MAIHPINGWDLSMFLITHMALGVCMKQYYWIQCDRCPVLCVSAYQSLHRQDALCCLSLFLPHFWSWHFIEMKAINLPLASLYPSIYSHACVCVYAHGENTHTSRSGHTRTHAHWQFWGLWGEARVVSGLYGVAMVIGDGFLGQALD